MCSYIQKNKSSGQKQNKFELSTFFFFLHYQNCAPVHLEKEAVCLDALTLYVKHTQFSLFFSEFHDYSGVLHILPNILKTILL